MRTLCRWLVCFWRGVWLATFMFSWLGIKDGATTRHWSDGPPHGSSSRRLSIHSAVRRSWDWPMLHAVVCTVHDNCEMCRHYSILWCRQTSPLMNQCFSTSIGSEIVGVARILDHERHNQMLEFIQSQANAMHIETTRKATKIMMINWYWRVSLSVGLSWLLFKQRCSSSLILLVVKKTE